MGFAFEGIERLLKLMDDVRKATWEKV